MFEACITFPNMSVLHLMTEFFLQPWSYKLLNIKEQRYSWSMLVPGIESPRNMLNHQEYRNHSNQRRKLKISLVTVFCVLLEECLGEMKSKESLVRDTPGQTPNPCLWQVEMTTVTGNAASAWEGWHLYPQLGRGHTGLVPTTSPNLQVHRLEASWWRKSELSIPGWEPSPITPRATSKQGFSLLHRSPPCSDFSLKMIRSGIFTALDWLPQPK